MKITPVSANTAQGVIQQQTLNNPQNNVHGTKPSSKEPISLSKKEKVIMTGAGALTSYGIFSFVINQLEKANASKIKTIGVLTATSALIFGTLTSSVMIAKKIQAKNKQN